MKSNDTKADASKARRAVSGKGVRRELLPNQSPELLKTLHLLTADGRLNADALRKLKQVNHLVGLLTPSLDDVLSRFGAPRLVDVGSGNAYLGFVLYELFVKGAEAAELLSVESRADLSSRAQERAKALGFGRMAFQTAAIADAQYPERLHLVTALHACDTATDDAIVAAVKHNADHIALVPCCQAEVAAQLKESARDGTDEVMAELYAHPWHRREFGSHLTNVIRALVLESLGYSVTVTELTGWEHSLKNELILGKKVRGADGRAKAKLLQLLQRTGVRPKVVRALELA